MNRSRESDPQKGLGLNPERMILEIRSSFRRFEMMMIAFITFKSSLVPLFEGL